MAVMSFLLAERNMKTHTQNGLAGGSVPSRVPPLVIKLESRNVNDSATIQIPSYIVKVCLAHRAAALCW